MNLILDKTVNAIALRKSFYEVILMLPDTLDEIRCYTDVQCAIRFTRKDVNARGSHVRAYGFPRSRE